jgi:uncharacterized protein YeaO (DUF488 family)
MGDDGTSTGFRVRRVYEEPDAGDGTRVLVDRLWPRGLAKEKAALDEWVKDLTPSGDLRSWFHAHPDRYEEFAERYRAELDRPETEEPTRHLRDLAGKGTVTLLTAVRNPDHSHIPVLRAHLEG